MKLCRFLTLTDPGPVHVGLLISDSAVLDLTPAGITQLGPFLERDDYLSELNRLRNEHLPERAMASLRLLAPLDHQEVWAAGVTYSRSKKARMEESDFSANAYDRVYDAPRPELFMKSLPEKVCGPGEPVGIRRDARWSVPEPELALVINSRGQICGYTVGNDMSSRDIEGENLLYLPQAKIYDRSCALGPCISVGVPEIEARTWTIRLQIQRQGKVEFAGETSVGKIKRSFSELAAYLYRSQRFPHGTTLLTGTSIVPPETFTLQSQDIITMTISGIGTLENPVVQV